MSAQPFRLVVIGDSLAFTDDKGPQLPTDFALYPNVVARALERELDRTVTVNVIARPGAGVREAWRAVFKDRHVQFEVLMGADAVVVGVGSIDHAPTGAPPLLDEVARHITNAAARRRVRQALRWVRPRVVTVTGGRFSHTPRAEFRRLYDGLLHQVRSLSQGVPGVVIGPTSHHTSHYGSTHPQHAAAERTHGEVATAHGFAFVKSWELVEPFHDQGNPDGIHWSPPAHQVVGEAVAARLIAQLRGEEPVPGIPW